MASQTVNLADGAASAPITVPALKVTGLVTDNPVSVETEGGAVIVPMTQRKHALTFISPIDTIIIRADQFAAVVELTTED
jgi:hypothetical protein